MGAAAWLAAAALVATEAFGAQGRDTVRAPQAGAAEPDTLAPDTLAVEFFPLFPDPARHAPGLAAEWRLAGLLASSGETLGALVELTAGLDPVRAGFLEGPEAALVAGRGAASFRLDQDGYEVAPILGGPLDLRLISLTEQERVRLIAEPGGFRAYAHTYRKRRPDAYSRIEAATGDRGVSLLRAFLSSRVGRTLVAFGFDRADASGLLETGGSTRTVVWASLARRLPAGLWGQIEYRRATADRDSFPDPTRRDWVLRVRRAFRGGWFADLVAGTASLDSDPGEPVPPDTVVRVRTAAARQVALRAARTGESFRTFLSVRFWGGDGVPNVETQGAVELDAGPAALYATGTYADWGGGLRTAGGYGALRLRLPPGLNLMAEAEEGDRVLFGFRPIKWMEYGRRTAGLEAELGGWRAGVRGGRWRTGPSPGLGPPIDSIGSRPGGTVDAVEAWAGGPVLRIFGGAVEVGGRYWTRETGEFLYWPEDEWRLEGVYHVLALSDQLEVRLRAVGGIRGAMTVPDRSQGPAGLTSTLDLTWWRAEAVVRVKDVHIFYAYHFFDSLGVRGEVPGRPLPLARFVLGVKWQFWN